MTIINRFGKQLAVVSTVLGLLLIILSFSSSPKITHAEIWLDGENTPFGVDIDSSYVANWILKAGIRLFPQDSIRYSGVQIPHDFILKSVENPQLVYKPAVPISLTTDGVVSGFYSGSSTLGEALWEQGILLKESDYLSLPLGTTLDKALSVTLRRGKLITIQTRSGEIDIPVTADTVGAALAQAGYALQNLDYSEPAADTLLQANQTIRVVRVQEAVITEDVPIPYGMERVSDPNINVGDEQILQSGKNGVQSTTVRVRYEDGEEVSRTVLSERVSQAPITERVAYGGNIVELSIGDIDYYLSMDVHITCYHWTGSPTAHGEWPSYGTIAVPTPWYSILVGSNIYIPSYGTGAVLDICPGCVGKLWIDVYKEDCAENPISYTETVYFLTPAPASFTGELP